MIRIDNLNLNLGQFSLKDLSIDIKENEYFIVLGPTGAGKTVLLEAIAGLNPISSGEIWINGREISYLRPEQRDISIVYQDQMLFPHLSVEKNIAFSLKMRRLNETEIKKRVTDVAIKLGIDHLLGRKPRTLSGGERQRTALARALVANPKVLLLDEPLGALDEETKEKLQHELKHIHQYFNITIIHVTHDFQEAIALGEHVAVLNEGQIVQTGTPDEVMRQPNSDFMAGFTLSRNVFTGITIDSEDDYTRVDVQGTRLIVITEQRGQIRLSLRPEDILLSKEPVHSTARNMLQGRVTKIVGCGALVYVTVNVPPDFVCLITRQSYEEMGLHQNIHLYVIFKASTVHVF